MFDAFYLSVNVNLRRQTGDDWPSAGGPVALLVSAFDLSVNVNLRRQTGDDWPLAGGPDGILYKTKKPGAKPGF